MKDVDDLLNGIYSQTISEVSVLVREVRVRVGVLTNFVTIRIYYNGRSAAPYWFELSASMKTALEAGAAETDRTAPSEGEALRRAVRLLTQDYDDAVRRGEMPDDQWLVALER